MTRDQAIIAMRGRTPVWGPRPLRPLLIQSIVETRYGHEAQLREMAQQPGCMQIVVNAQDPRAFLRDLELS